MDLKARREGEGSISRQYVWLIVIFEAGMKEGEDRKGNDSKVKDHMCVKYSSFGPTGVCCATG
jgi:hypothetical protein